MGRDTEETRELSVESLETRVPVDKKEADAWLWLDWANSAYSQVGMSGFLPICIQQAAMIRSGFPLVCPNVVIDADRARAAFPAHNWTSDPIMYAMREYVPDPCGSTTAQTDPVCNDGFCRGLPTVLGHCLEEDGATPYALGVVGEGSVSPVAFASVCISVSVLCQLVSFITIGSVADFGPLRKTLLTAFTLAGAASMVATLLVSPSLFWLGGILMVVSNVCFGMTQVLYSAYLPVLIRDMPDTLVRPPAARSCTPNVWPRLPDVSPTCSRYEADCRRSEELSNAGFAFGYFAGLLGLILSVPLILLLTAPQTTLHTPASILGYQLTMVLVGLWWAGFYFSCSYKRLRQRPGPPLPPGRGYVTQSVAGFRSTLQSLREHKVALRYLVLWFFFSDGVFVVGTIATLFADSEIDWQCIPKGLGLLGMTILASVGAGVGNLVATRVQRRLQVDARRMLAASLLGAMCLPAYGLVGLVSPDFGLRKGWELLVLAGVYGMSMGPMQGFSRTIFGNLIPHGKESAFFALYEVTDKGSSFVGPLVLGAVSQATGSMRLGLFYSLAFIAVPLALLPSVDLAAGYAAAHNTNTNDPHPQADPLHHAGEGCSQDGGGVGGGDVEMGGRSGRSPQAVRGVVRGRSADAEHEGTPLTAVAAL